MRAWLIALLIISSKLAIGQTPAASGFQAMLNGYYEEFLKLNPTTASSRGDYRYNDQLENARTSKAGVCMPKVWGKL